MKKKKLNKKLSLNKESIANLNSLEMRKINGGNHQHENTEESEQCLNTEFICEIFTFC